MEIHVSADGEIAGTLVFAVNEGTDGLSDDLLIGMDSTLATQIESVLFAGDFKAKLGKNLTLYSPESKALLIGLGNSKERKMHDFREAGASVIANLTKSHGKELTLRFDDINSNEISAFIEGMMLRDYKYDLYLSKDKDEDDDSELIVNIQCGEKSNSVSKSTTIAQGVATGVHKARDLGNAPPNEMFPMAYANQAIEWAKHWENAKVTVIEYKEAMNLGMGGLCGVGMGSDRKPCMVIFELNPEKNEKNPPVIVGKGITFDTGGISIKPSAGMDEMKYDMHGSATVFGLMQALMATNHEEYVVGISCMAENMLSSNAQRPGDIIRTLSGKTVEVLNTDAEGRLVLSDGLWKAGDYNPKFIIDLATLTGAVVVALGHEATGMWCNDSELQSRIQSSGDACGELIWPMPLLPAFEKEMKDSKIADLRNIGETRWGGSNTAAAYLKQFVQTRGEDDDKKQFPWAHLDIAGTAWGAKTNKMTSHGATGIHVRALHHLITNT